MRIYLLRHGIAEEGMGKRDSERALTAEGKAKLQDTLELASKAGVAPTLILSSPYKRAMETARIAVQSLDYKGPLIEMSSLVPDSSPQSAWSDLKVHAGEDSVLLVGHEPLFSALAAFLLGCPNLSIDFKKGGLLCVELFTVRAQPAGVLKWYLTPKFASHDQD